MIYVYKDDGMFIRAARHINTNKMQQTSQLIFLRVEKIDIIEKIKKSSCPYEKLLLFIINQRVLGVVGLSVGECINVELFVVVQCEVTFPEEGSQHQWIPGYQNKAVILPKGG